MTARITDTTTFDLTSFAEEFENAGDTDIRFVTDELLD